MLDPETDRAAAYNGIHRLIDARASARLVAWAKENFVKKQRWNPALHDPTSKWHRLPSWATPEVLERCELLWVRSGGESDAELLARPGA